MAVTVLFEVDAELRQGDAQHDRYIGVGLRRYRGRDHGSNGPDPCAGTILQDAGSADIMLRRRTFAVSNPSMNKSGSAHGLPNEWDLEIGQRLKEVRLAHDLTQDDFADRLGQRRSNWSMVETGRQAPAKEAGMHRPARDLAGTDSHDLMGHQAAKRRGLWLSKG